MARTCVRFLWLWAQGKKLTIHGFEPIKPTWEAAVRNLKSFPNVTVHNVVWLTQLLHLFVCVGVFFCGGL